MSVYFPRSAVRPTISGRAPATSTRARPNGASTVGRSTIEGSSWPIAKVRVRSDIGRAPLEFSEEALPLTRIDANEMRLLTSLEGRDALSGQGAEDDGLGLAGRDSCFV